MERWPKGCDSVAEIYEIDREIAAVAVKDKKPVIASRFRLCTTVKDLFAEIESREPGASFSYNQIAKKYGVGRRTLARRHQGQNQPHTLAHHILHPQQEKELVQYIKRLTERRTPPTRVMIRGFASSLAGKEVSES